MTDRPYSDDPEYAEWLKESHGPLKHNLALLSMSMAQATRLNMPGVVKDLHKELLATIRTNNAMKLEEKETWSLEERDAFAQKLHRAVADVIKARFPDDGVWQEIVSDVADQFVLIEAETKGSPMTLEQVRAMRAQRKLKAVQND